MTTSLLNDGQPQNAGILEVTAHCLSSESELRFRSYGLFHRICEEMALGTRPTIQHPRRSQIAPNRRAATRPAVAASVVDRHWLRFQPAPDTLPV